MSKKKISWIERKLTDREFKAAFELEYEKISIGEQLASLRISANLTQAAVAEKVGTTASAISCYESARYDRYELKTLQKIVSACGGIMHIVMEPAQKRAAPVVDWWYLVSEPLYYSGALRAIGCVCSLMRYQVPLEIFHG